MSNFDAAFAIVVGVEGGYKPATLADPGGETKYGISKRQYPNVDIPQLTLEQARAIYLRDYWNTHGCDHLSWTEALLVFDCSVNGGPATRWLQMYGGTPPKEFAINFQAEHIQYLASLPNWGPNARGWSRRLLNVFNHALETP